MYLPCTAKLAHRALLLTAGQEDSMDAGKKIFDNIFCLEPQMGGEKLEMEKGMGMKNHLWPWSWGLSTLL